VDEREYWMDMYHFFSSASNDKIYSAETFFDLPVTFLEVSLKSLQRIDKQRVQKASLTTAYLTDTVLSIVHSLYGKEGSPKYKSDPEKFLPGYEAPELSAEETDNTLEPSSETIRILLTSIKEQKLNGLIIAHLAELIPVWAEKYG